MNAIKVLEISLTKHFVVFFKKNKFLVALGLHCYEGAFSSRNKWGLLFDAMCRLLIVVASLVTEHR